MAPTATGRRRCRGAPPTWLAALVPLAVFLFSASTVRAQDAPDACPAPLVILLTDGNGTLCLADNSAADPPCHHAIAPRNLPFLVADRPDMSLRLCATLCAENGHYGTAGVENGTSCWCSGAGTIGPQGTILPNNRCRTPCPVRPSPLLRLSFFSLVYPALTMSFVGPPVADVRRRVHADAVYVPLPVLVRPEPVRASRHRRVCLAHRLPAERVFRRVHARHRPYSVAAADAASAPPPQVRRPAARPGHAPHHHRPGRRRALPGPRRRVALLPGYLVPPVWCRYWPRFADLPGAAQAAAAASCCPMPPSGARLGHLSPTVRVSPRARYYVAARRSDARRRPPAPLATSASRRPTTECFSNPRKKAIYYYLSFTGRGHPTALANSVRSTGSGLVLFSYVTVTKMADVAVVVKFLRSEVGASPAGTGMAGLRR